MLPTWGMWQGQEEAKEASGLGVGESATWKMAQIQIQKIGVIPDGPLGTVGAGRVWIRRIHGKGT